MTVRDRLREIGCAVVVPFYNNAGTVAQVLEELKDYCDTVIAVNDGSTDGSLDIAKAVEGISVVGYAKNRGKGYAIRFGLKKADEMGCNYAICIDADGQHFPSDLQKFAFFEGLDSKTLIVGARQDIQGQKAGSSFANKFSNFWFRVETGINLSDTQSGYRLYPIKAINKRHFLCNRYGFEVEVLVRAAWAGIKIAETPVSVYYPPAEQRVSHFRPGKDFLLISLLNTGLCIAAIYGRLKMALTEN